MKTIAKIFIAIALLVGIPLSALAVNMDIYTKYQEPSAGHIDAQLYLADPRYEGVAGPSTGSFDIVASGEDNSTTFLSLQDGLNYLFSGYASGLVSTVNSAMSMSYSLGSMVFVQKPVSDADATKQPLHNILTQISGIGASISSDMLTLLGQPDVASVKSAMALGMSDISGLTTAVSGKEASVTGSTSNKFYDGTKIFRLFVINDISDATSIGKSLLSAADAAAIRSLLSVGTGTVTSVTCGTGLSGGAITTTGTCSLPNTGTAGTYSGVTTDAQGRVTAGTTRSFNSAPGRSLVTGTGATGFQVSSTRDAIANYSVTITTAVQIGVVTNVEGYVALEIAPTNSATAGDWVEIGRVTQANNIALALALSSTQKGGGQIGGVIPAGYYAKLRTVNTSGTPTYALNSGQEVQL